MLKDFTQLKSVKAETDREDEEQALFKKETSCYTKQKKGASKKEKSMRQRNESCDNQYMFENLLKNTEGKDGKEKMPVRKFFTNTFGNMLNDAIFQLKKQ